MIVDLLASPAVAGFSVSKTRGQGPTSGPPEHPTEHHAVISPPPTPTRRLVGQQRLQPGPFLVGQIVSMQHRTGLPHPTLMIRGTRSNLPGRRSRRSSALPLLPTSTAPTGARRRTPARFSLWPAFPAAHGRRRTTQ